MEERIKELEARVNALESMLDLVSKAHMDFIRLLKDKNVIEKSEAMTLGVNIVCDGIEAIEGMLKDGVSDV